MCHCRETVFTFLSPTYRVVPLTPFLGYCHRMAIGFVVALATFRRSVGRVPLASRSCAAYRTHGMTYASGHARRGHVGPTPCEARLSMVFAAAATDGVEQPWCSASVPRVAHASEKGAGLLENPTRPKSIDSRRPRVVVVQHDQQVGCWLRYLAHALHAPTAAAHVEVRLSDAVDFDRPKC